MILQLHCVLVCVSVWEGRVWGVDGGWMRLPTRPQRYCDPASLVLHRFDLFLACPLNFFFFNVAQLVHLTAWGSNKCYAAYRKRYAFIAVALLYTYPNN